MLSVFGQTRKSVTSVQPTREAMKIQNDTPSSIKLEDSLTSTSKYRITPKIPKVLVAPLSCADAKPKRIRTLTPLKPLRWSERNKVRILIYLIVIT